MKIIFSNEHFVALDKEAGVLTVPSRIGAKDPRPVLGLILQEELRQKVFPVHRLDYEVSGLVLFARSAEAHRLASAWFEKKQIQKTYRALTGLQDFSHWPEKIPCERAPISTEMPEPVMWKSRLLRGKKRSYESPEGDLAETLAQLVRIDSQNSLAEWNLQPLTGRSHQLRYELSRHGFPILGDALYGSKKIFAQDKIALRAVQLSLQKISGDKLGLPEILEVPADRDQERLLK